MASCRGSAIFGALRWPRFFISNIFVAIDIFCRGRWRKQELKCLVNSKHKLGKIYVDIFVDTYFDQNCTLEHPLHDIFFIVGHRFRVQKGQPGISCDTKIRMTISNLLPNSTKVSLESLYGQLEFVLKITHISSSQLYSIGQRSRPVTSCSNPLSNLQVGDNRTMGSLNRERTQLTTAGFRLAVSSPRAPLAPLRSYKEWV